jgi:hypothetical protein
MAVIILSQKFAYNEQAFEIFVKYDIVLQKAIEVKHINLQTHGTWYPVGTIMDKFFKDAIWKLINETSWPAIYKEYCDPEPKKDLPVKQDMTTERVYDHFTI